ncbi:MAG TPA: ATP-binding protein [Flavobacterium sp.]|jgi:signal transduction histidine kinase
MKLSTQILLAFTIIIMLSVADSYTNYLLSKKVEHNSRFLSKSEAIIRNSNRMHKAIIGMQSAFRGYLLTEDSTFLDTYYRGKHEVPEFGKAQSRLVEDNLPQKLLLDSIMRLHMEWAGYSKQIIDSRRRVAESRERQLVYRNLFEGKLKKQVGKKINDEISEKFGRFDRMEYRIRKVHGAALAESIENTHVFSLIALSLTIIIGIGSTVYIVMLISKRIAKMVRLAENISQGEFSVVNDTRNDELTGLSRSLNIMSEKLRKNIRELENRNAELNKFAYVVSHDLKAPIRGIHNVVKWIEEDLGGELSAQMKKYLQIIPQRTQRMEALINGLLDYARISRKTPAENVNLNALVQEIADSIVPRTFRLEVDPLPTLYAERIKLEQVFANLISNSVKYTPHPGGNIKISFRELPRYLEFSVKDDGIGIDPEYHQKIFEIFQTLREKNEKESTGVGLAIVKKIIDEQQGTITVKSASGEGAEFIFTWKKN